MKRKRGFLISFEGGEGGGKTVQAKRLKRKLKRRGKKVILIREPGGPDISEQIREVLLDAENTEMTVTTEMLLFQAARAQLYEEEVLPDIKKGRIVISDRGRDSSLVYQGVVRGMGEKLVEKLNDVATKNTLPELTILLDVPVKIGKKRQENEEESDRMDLEEAGFRKKVRKAYLRLAKRHPNRLVVVDGSREKREVAKEVWEVVKNRLKLR